MEAQEDTSRRVMSEAITTRVGAVALPLGIVLLAVSEALHPSGEDPMDHSAVFREYAESDVWTTVHLGQYFGFLLVLGGLVTLAIQSWVWTALVSGVVAFAYVAIGRRYLHRRIAVDAVKTNIDTIIGRTGTVRPAVEPDRDGIVRVGNEEWRARASESLPQGETIVVTAIKGVTLTVVKKAAGSSVP